jgi:hypothetical protein
MVNVVVETDRIYRKTSFNGVTGLGFLIRSADLYQAGGSLTKHVWCLLYSHATATNPHSLAQFVQRSRFAATMTYCGSRR